MTCVVGLIDKETKKVYIGGDTLASSGDFKINRKDSKVFKSGSFVLGYTGSYRFGQILKYITPPSDLAFDSFFPVTDDKEFEFLVKIYIPDIRLSLEKEGCLSKDEEGADMTHTALIGINGRLFWVDSDFHIAESAYDYFAIGSGKEVAIGSLYTSGFVENFSTERRIRIAIDAASNFIQSVGGNIDLIST